ncbi:NDP-sugar synthase [Thermodesulfobacteriota bacterium]
MSRKSPDRRVAPRARAIVLAAGLGDRLRPLTSKIPKPLLPVAGRPLIEYGLELLGRHGIRDVVINLHHLHEQISTTLGDGSGLGMRIRYSLEMPEILGTGGGIKKAEPMLSEGTFIVINSDILIDVDLSDVLSFHRQNGAAATMVLREDPDACKWGAVSVDEGMRVRSVVGRPAVVGKDLKDFMFTGAHVMEPAVFRYMPAGRPFSITGVTYPDMIAAGERVLAYLHHGYWTDLGTPERYESACVDLEAGRFPPK